MNPSLDLDLVSNAIIALAAPGAIAFTLLYGLRSAWRATRAGRALMWLSVSLSGTMLYYALFVLLGPDYRFREPYSVVLAIAVTSNIYRMLWVLIRAQRYDQRLPDLEVGKKEKQ